MNVEDALNYIVASLRSGSSSAAYGYQVYVRNIVSAYLQTEKGLGGLQLDAELPSCSPYFLDAAWELCRRGILRPGVHRFGAQATDEGSAGSGFSITPFGRQWLEERDRDDYVPTEPGRFAAMIAEHGDRFGPGFQERAQEAIRCYGAHAYLACCAMCGAAAESILLAAAIAKEGDEAAVLKAYSTQGSRGRVEKKLLGQATESVKREFQGYSALLKYWRDEAAHGTASGIDDDEAYTSLALLLRFAHYVEERWVEIVG